MNAREELDVAAENLCQRVRRRLPPRPLRLRQEVQRRLEVQHLRLAGDGEGQARHRLVEELVPGRGADRRLVVQEALQLVRELVGLHRPHPVEGRPVARDRVARRKERRVSRVLYPVEFQREEDERGGERSDPVLAVRQELRPTGIGGVLVVAQAGIGHDPPRQRLDPLVAVDAAEHPRRVERGEPALVVGGEGGAGALQLGQVARHLRRVGCGVEVGQIPFGQAAQPAGGGIGIKDGAGQADGHGGLLVSVRPR